MRITRGIVTKSFLWKFFEKTSVQAVNFLITIVLARLLLPSEFGIVALILVFINIANVIVDGGFNSALIQSKEADDTDFATIFFFCIAVSIGMYGILFFCAPLISAFYKNVELVKVIRVLSFILVLYAINSIQHAYIAKNMLFKKLFVCSFFSVLLSGLIGIFLAYRGYGVWAIVFQQLFLQLLSIIFTFYYVKWYPKWRFSMTSLHKLFDYGWKIFASNIIISIFTNIRKLIVGRVFSPSSLAFFERGEQFPSLIMANINTSINAVLFPSFSNEQDNKQKVKHMMRRATKISCFFIYPLTTLLIVSAAPLVSFLLTDKWQPTVPFIQILSIANYFLPITLANLIAIKALGYSNIILKLELVKKVIDIIILIVSVSLGLHAIAWGIVVYNFICIFINLYPSKKILEYGIPEQVKDALPTLFVSLIMGGMVYWIQFVQYPPLIVLFLQLTAGIFIYTILCILIREESMLYLYNIIRKKLENQI